MNFQVSALPRTLFESLFALDAAQLNERGARRYIADRKPGFPCRVSLDDAEPGEPVLLVPFTHQPSDSPYRATGPIFVRESARQSSPGRNEVPEQLRRRLLSLRAYDDDGLMVDCEVADGREVEPAIDKLFANPNARYLHVHFARPGCYACRVDRAQTPDGDLR
jgi:uncharacterized protein DUF1203